MERSIGKVFQIVIDNRIVDLIKLNNIIYDHQFGFMKHIGTKIFYKFNLQKIRC